MLEEFRGDVFVNRILTRQLERHSHHVQAKHPHPAGAIALLEMAAVRQRRAPIEDTDVIEAEETALENIFPFGILPVHPPGEGDEQLVERRFEKSAVAPAGLFFFDLVNAPRGPTHDRRIHVAEVPFVGGDLAVGMLIPFAQDDIELALGEERIDQRERDAMERQVPRGVPRIFPLVRHRHDALVVKMAPLGVASASSVPAGGAGWRGSPSSQSSMT